MRTRDESGGVKSGLPCGFEGCGRLRKAKGLCARHYTQAWAGHTLTPKTRTKGVGEGYLSRGYRRMKPAGENPYVTNVDGTILEHRLVMSEALGRPLTADEQVHHINGDKLDNRLENLELWACSQPSGQRIEDKVEWAVGILALYRPELLQRDPALT